MANFPDTTTNGSQFSLPQGKPPFLKWQRHTVFGEVGFEEWMLLIRHCQC